MDKIIVSIIIILCVFITFILYEKEKYQLQISSIDGKEYFVYSYNNSQDAANILSRLNISIAKLVSHLKIKYGKNHTVVNKLITRYNPDVIYELIPTWLSGNVAYTRGKGKSLYICLRPIFRNDNLLHDFNTIMFVALHEITHVATNVKDHPPEFWRTFKFILDESVKIGIYKPVDYSHANVTYCDDNMVINYNPYYDIKLDIKKFQNIHIV